MKLAALAALLSLLAVSAHPGEDHTHEAEERRTALNSMGRRSLSHCHEQLAARGVHERNNVRRRAFLDHAKTAMRKRDLASALATSHASNLTGVTNTTASSTLFTGEALCVLAPEVTEGPYYITGEYWRRDVRESQAGVAMYLDIQVIDTNTCEPLSGAAFDFWHANSTGVYSGIVASGNGNSADATNINATFLRGVQETDSDGVVQFLSTVPGHYDGRCNHAHIIAHAPGAWELLSNNTISGSTQAAHVGQLFFDQDLLTEVEAVEPYTSNTQAHTLNSADSILAEEAATVDPFVEYVLLGDSISDGIFAWITVGVNATADHTVSAAASYGADGGVANANAMGGAGGAPGGGMGGNGTAPTGGMGGNGTAPSGAGAGGANTTAAAGADAANNSNASANASATAAAATNGTSWATGYAGLTPVLMGLPAVAMAMVL